MKKLLEYLPFHFLCFLVFGIVTKFYTDVWSFGKLALVFSLLGLMLILFVFKRCKGFELFVYGFFFLLGVAVVFLDDARNTSNYYENFHGPNTIKKLKITKVLKPGNFYSKYEASVVKIDSFVTTGTVLINIKKDSVLKQFQVGQFLFTKVDFKELIPPLNPHQFDYKSYLAKQGIHQQVFLETKQFVVKNKYDLSLLRTAYLIRTKIQQSLKKNGFKGDAFAVLNALLLGQRQDISKELIDDYAKAGAIHILAVSGLHVGIILLILNFLFKPLERFKQGKIYKVLLIVLLLWGFALIAGLSASVTRAVTMFSAVALGQLFGRRNSVEYSLIISMFILLLIKPMFLFDVGFQLSYLAVFGIIWVQPKLYQLWKPKWKLIDFYWQLFTVSIAAQFGILPISLFYFHQFPGLFILSNLVVIPFLGAILVGGIITILLSVLNVIPEFFVDAYNLVISLMNCFIQWISHQESWLLTEISFSNKMLVVSYVVIIFGFQFLVKKRTRHLIYFLITILLFQSVLWFEKWQVNSKSEFIVFHKSRYSVFGERLGNQMNIYHNIDGQKIVKEKLVTSYTVGEEVCVKLNDSIPRFFELDNQSILLIDKQGIYPQNVLELPIVVLKDSPKINLDRLIQELKPSYIVANGSNYKSSVLKWEQTCIKTKTPFWYTGQKGAYIVE